MFMGFLAWLATVGKLIGAALFLALMLWLAWRREKSRCERDLRGYSPTLDLNPKLPRRLPNLDIANRA